MSSDKKVVIIGGGLVGSLCACFMAKSGFSVNLYEYRQDIRSSKLDNKGRSINLALSNRGRKALKSIGIEDEVLGEAIPMRGRFLHNKNGRNASVLYDTKHKQCIYSVSRTFLNCALLSAAENYPNVQIHFSHKLVCADFDEETVTFVKVGTQERVKAGADLIIGADGAFSALRRSMQSTRLFDFSQSYAKHGYLELSVPPSRGGRMEPNHLHIWPRGDFMMIALPNRDASWTVTLFMPFEIFASLTTPNEVVGFFKRTFPDSLGLLGERRLVEDFFRAKPSSLVSVKCSPYHVSGKFVLIGDAAHAMVPFYGQGMNAGFEDCLVLDETLRAFEGDVRAALEEYSALRRKDAHSICDLAMYNYVEMRDLVNRRSYKLRRMLDDLLYNLLDDRWVPLYNSVTFTDMPYSECVENRKWQDKVIGVAMATSALIFTTALSTLFYYYNC